ncbi:hypothetical protein FM996_04610 [Methylosinus sporium]|uniref:Uncharacterized protein n=1 Tax=Methylosinus sporium TaxID=428 RepID=A0A549T3R6_METSR|nr:MULTISPECIES: hypothetical protein [Methylosinus]MBU3886854.1 hypothetical protein [Methylosinus sp. KRF6]TRL36545.1 hypothetical protein FM996_04610 [Methylosinus sporium]
MIETGSYELLSFEEARQKLRFDREISLGLFDLSSFRIAYCPGDFVYVGDIELYQWMWCDKIAGLVVDGDMTIEGDLMDNSFDGAAAFVLARGNLRARTVTLGGAEVVVRGDLRAEGPVFNSSTAGRCEIGGSLHASHLVTDDHATVVAGRAPARSFALGYVDPTMSEKLRPAKSYLDLLTPEAAEEFDAQFRGAGPEIVMRIVAAIRAGRSVLRV